MTQQDIVPDKINLEGTYRLGKEAIKRQQLNVLIEPRNGCYENCVWGKVSESSLKEVMSNLRPES